MYTRAASPATRTAAGGTAVRAGDCCGTCSVRQGRQGRDRRVDVGMDEVGQLASGQLPSPCKPASTVDLGCGHESAGTATYAYRPCSRLQPSCSSLYCCRQGECTKNVKVAAGNGGRAIAGLATTGETAGGRVAARHFPAATLSWLRKPRRSPAVRCSTAVRHCVLLSPQAHA